MFYAEISTLEKTTARHRIIREIEDSPPGTFTRRRRITSARLRLHQFVYARNGVDIAGATLAKMRELDGYGLFHFTRAAPPNQRTEANLSLSGIGRRTLAHWDGVVDLPYSAIVNGKKIEFTIDLTGRVRAPEMEPFDVESPEQARRAITDAFAVQQEPDA